MSIHGAMANQKMPTWNRGGKLEAQGERVALFDWELDEVTHRGRLEKMFGRERMPSIRYVRCDRPLVHSSASYRRPPPGARQQGRDRGSAAVRVRLLAQLGALHLVR